MKTIFKYILISGTLFLTSCESDLTSINVNPNDLVSVDAKHLFTYVSKDIFQVDGDNLFASRMMIAIDGENSYQYYKWNDASFSDYSSTLLNVSKMILEAESVGNKNYVAIGKFYRAVIFYKLTLQFGDIPYSEALMGESYITKPKYDKQEDVFAGILKELKESNDLINATEKIEGDIIYQGDSQKWKRLINSYRLKVLMTLSKKSSVNGLNVASEFANIATTQPLMESIADNGQLSFFDAADSRYSTFNDSGYGSSLYIANYFVNLFKDRKDPRLFTFAEQTSGAKEAGKAITDFSSYNGGNPISPYSDNAALVTAKNISKINTRFYLDPVNEPSNILSYSELEFILAEGSVRNWINSASAKSHYEKGVAASFDFYRKYVKNAEAYFTGFNIDNYLQSDVVKFNEGGSVEDKMKLILGQKYLTMFHQSQWTSYYDYLRTQYPLFPLPTGMSHPPYRFRYPMPEYNYNSENLKTALLRQFNGKDDINEIPWWLQ